MWRVSSQFSGRSALVSEEALPVLGATDDEMAMALPGDALLRRADLTATRAITIRCTAEGIWPWAGPARTRPWRLLQL
jgi:hypothetical protein